MSNYDLCLTWNWEYDADFVRLLDGACKSHGLSLLQITPENLSEMMRSLANKEILLQNLFDRASDTDASFIPVVQWACDHASHQINSHELACRAEDKVAMHQAISVSMSTPFTIFLPSYDEQPLLPAIDVASLGSSFTVKPALGGGGDGVINKATTLRQVSAARQEFATQRYLLQAYIIPAQLGTRMAWFRVIYCAGRVYSCWWDNFTHIYTPVTSDEENSYNLGPLRELSFLIARICGLDLFSTEIALTPDGHFVIVDYVNDPIDLRLRSKTFDGVPDDIVQDITERLTEIVLNHYPPSRGQKIIVSSGQGMAGGTTRSPLSASTISS